MKDEIPIVKTMKNSNKPIKPLIRITEQPEVLENMDKKDIKKYDKTVDTLRNNIIFKHIIKDYYSNEDYNFIHYMNEKLPDNILKYSLKFENEEENLEITIDINTNKCIINKEQGNKENINLLKDISNKFTNANINLKNMLKSINEISDFNLSLNIENFKFTNLQIAHLNKYTKIDLKRVIGEVYADNIYSNPEDFSINVLVDFDQISEDSIKYEIKFVNESNKNIKNFNQISNLDSFLKINTAINIYENITKKDYGLYISGNLENINNKALKSNDKEYKKTMKHFMDFIKTFDKNITKNDFLKYIKIKIHTYDGIQKNIYQSLFKNYFSNNNVENNVINK